jgi:hypothetical protein
MDFNARKLKFGFKDKATFDADAVKSALEGQRFSNVEMLSGP